MLLLTVASAYSQDKLEREYRIQPSQVPAKALEFTAAGFNEVKLKWYGEENLDGKAIEAKGKRDGTLYSIKFDTLGMVQDIEMVIRFHTIPEATRLNIEKDLASRFSKFNIQKTQKQWLGTPQVLRALARGENVNNEFKTNYEITLRGTKDRRTDYYEVLANDRGTIVRESKIVQRNNQHLIY